MGCILECEGEGPQDKIRTCSDAKTDAYAQIESTWLTKRRKKGKGVIKRRV